MHAVGSIVATAVGGEALLLLVMVWHTAQSAPAASIVALGVALRVTAAALAVHCQVQNTGGLNPIGLGILHTLQSLALAPGCCLRATRVASLRHWVAPESLAGIKCWVALPNTLLPLCR
jgi:hypothetical protein